MDFETINDKLADFAAPMLTDPDITAEDGIRIAAALMFLAEHIFTAIGGPELAAQQFYVVADKCATQSEERHDD